MVVVGTSAEACPDLESLTAKIVLSKFLFMIFGSLRLLSKSSYLGRISLARWAI